jgi:hypothetical protein
VQVDVNSSNALVLLNDTESLQFTLLIIQNTASGCCDFLAQCILVRINHCPYHPLYSPKSSKIYRCWIVWGQNIRVVIVPSIMAITYLGQSINSYLISRFQFIALATWLAPLGGTTYVQGNFLVDSWGGPVNITSITLSMAVNTLVTGLIAFRILTVFLKVKAATTSVERTLGTTGGSKLHHVIFIVIESGMALLAIQLVRFVLFNLTRLLQPESPPAGFTFAYDFSIYINQMFNVIIRAVHFYFFCFTDIIYLARASHQQ